MAVNCCVAPTKRLGLDGVTAMEANVGAALTVRVVLPATPASAAVRVAVPAETAVAKPLALMVAAAVLDEVQVAWLVTFCVLPSE